MISDKSRDGWIGASDTHYVMSNWNTTTFYNWWCEKLGLRTNQLNNVYLQTGNAKEHQIANALGIKLTLDRQVKIKELRLRVNLDAETKDSIYEIKTYKLTNKEWKLPVSYRQQIQVQMFATKKRKWGIIAYGLLEEDYDNFFLPIAQERIKRFEIAYDEHWIQTKYLPRLMYLAECLKKRKTPNKEEFERRQNNEKN